jgi:hypothetical protein
LDGLRCFGGSYGNVLHWCIDVGGVPVCSSRQLAETHIQCVSRQLRTTILYHHESYGGHQHHGEQSMEKGVLSSSQDCGQDLSKNVSMGAVVGLSMCFGLVMMCFLGYLVYRHRADQQDQEV